MQYAFAGNPAGNSSAGSEHGLTGAGIARRQGFPGPVPHLLDWVAIRGSMDRPFLPEASHAAKPLAAKP